MLECTMINCCRSFNYSHLRVKWIGGSGDGSGIRSKQYASEPFLSLIVVVTFFYNYTNFIFSSIVYLYNVICFRKKLFLVSVKLWLWVSDWVCISLQYIRLNGVELVQPLFDIISSYISNVANLANLAHTQTYGKIIASLFIRLVLFCVRVSFIRVTIYCVLLLFLLVLLLNHDCMFASVWFSLIRSHWVFLLHQHLSISQLFLLFFFTLTLCSFHHRVLIYDPKATKYFMDLS